jgi:hypothetical protein
MSNCQHKLSSCSREVVRSLKLRILRQGQECVKPPRMRLTWTRQPCKHMMSPSDIGTFHRACRRWVHGHRADGSAAQSTTWEACLPHTVASPPDLSASSSYTSPKLTKPHTSTLRSRRVHTTTCAHDQPLTVQRDGAPHSRAVPIVII